MKKLISGYAKEKIYIEYDMSKNPFFEVSVKEELKHLTKTKTGKLLLKRIGEANPKKKTPGGYNVCIMPLEERTFRPVGKQLVEQDGVWVELDLSWMLDVGDTRRFVLASSGNRHKAIADEHVYNKQGSAAKVNFTNTIRQMSSGLKSPPFIGLGHELIHAYHALYGCMKANGTDEEKCTVGLGKFSSEEITENKIRAEAKLPLRTQY